MNRKLDNGMFVVDVGYRNNIPVALVEKQYNNTVEYIINRERYEKADMRRNIFLHLKMREP